MFQGSFKGEAFWSPIFSAETNLVFDIHNYYFQGRAACPSNVTELIYIDTVNSAGDGKFPTFVGERSVQTEIANTLSSRAKTLQTGLVAWKKYTRGSAYWTTKFNGNDTVDGEGTQADYWNYETFIDLGYTKSTSEAVSC
ncbi:hypothetical protein PENSTE_c017G10260 [Penicillium steckii]|uniref:Glycoside hydrolase family 5 domain-containing protein n=1 Tax=Penicillium steckii TaxID=303698 RepID=A0A1V6SZ46_9EURO|nr:hypothetical protein PENSTE_c017G10260 [Penicillium steckii]